tara:strand:+ start:268 stop:873 length:606 start_codon:yes stop_codon:yes gene_type:complete
MIKINFLALILIFICAFSQANSIDATIITCNDCHGAKGVSSDSDIPSIAGFSQASLLDMFAAYVDESRIAHKSNYRHGDIQRPATDMFSIAKNLSKAEVEAIANYYAQQKFVPAKQVFDTELAKKGSKLHEQRCTKCHEDGGSNADDDAGILAGQWQPYLAQTIREYRSGSRKTGKNMKKLLDNLSEPEIAALIHFYASQQ